MIENRLREASPTTTFKSPQFLDIGGMNGTRYRDLLFMDLAEIKSVKSATLSLFWYYPADKARTMDTVIEVFRPALPWNSENVSWKNRDKNVLWSKAGGDWYDKEGVLHGSNPYATMVLKGSDYPDNKYHGLDVTDLLKEYISGKYENTGILLKAKSEQDNYIAFYSSSEKNAPLFEVIEEVPIVVDPEEPPIVEEPPEDKTYIMIVCSSLADAQALRDDLQAHIGDRLIEIYQPAKTN